MLMIDKSDVDDDNEFDNEDGINDDDDKNNIILFNRIESQFYIMNIIYSINKKNKCISLQ